MFDLTLQATWPPGPLADRARELKIDHIRRGVVDGSDVAWYSLGPTGGWEPDDGNLVVDWLDALVVDPAYLDLTNKLQIQLADELHIFVVTGSATPHDADSALRQIDRIAPTRDPDLPGWITHAWVVSQWASGRSAGLWTRGQGWSIVPI